nr:glycosyltransferase [Solobacterium sp.]
MSTVPFLSVIIPFYNTGTWLPRSVDSVLKQTFQDTEIILVDDGSTDRSGV